MNPPATSRALVIVLLSLAMAACGAGEAGAESGAKLALKVSDEATAADVGLPAYPGAKPYVDSDHSGAANLGLATPLFGFKVVVTSLQTQDAPERVAAFYRKALAKYGKVLDCSDAGTASIEIKAGSEDDDELTCDTDEHGEHDLVFKAGTEKNQRIVAIKPQGNGTRFSLVHLNVRGESQQ